ncbi:LD-carboxypeptidase, partial [Arthrospira platensis SPKY1]|nr:LD-carboxypeptidase [Arthrospira platensis SPKY1]
AHPKLVIGYSDITALSWALAAKAQLPSISGSMVAADFGDPRATTDNLKQAVDVWLSGRFRISIPRIELESSPTALEGRLYPATLSVAAKLIGTPYLPDLSGSLLLIEDIGEPSRKLDGYLQQVVLAGQFHNIQALLLGDFDGRAEADGADYPSDVFLGGLPPTEQVVRIPGWPYGHIPDKRSFPVGLPVRLFADGSNWVLESVHSLYH